MSYKSIQLFTEFEVKPKIEGSFDAALKLAMFLYVTGRIVLNARTLDYEWNKNLSYDQINELISQGYEKIKGEGVY